MTVKELKEELTCYDDDMEVKFEIDDEVEIDSVTFDRYDFGTARIRGELTPRFISECCGQMRIELEADNEQ